MERKLVGKMEFSQVEGIRQLISHDQARKFLILNLSDELGDYALSWRSDLVEPIIELSPTKSHLWVGVDQQVAAICLSTGQISLKFSLFSNILKLKFLSSNSVIVVLTECDILLINLDFSIRGIYGLPDIPNAVSPVNSQSQLKIDLIDGQTLILDI